MKRLLTPLLLAAVTAATYGGSQTTEESIYLDAAANHVKEALRQGKPLSWKTDALVVPNANVAEAIHSAVAGSVYGDEKIQKQRPFRAVRTGEFWVVFGSLPEKTLGGTAVTVIRASNGEILRVVHER
jgi:NTF2 fold immunity protein